MRTQYGNVTAAPVDVGRRVVARLIVGAFGLAANFIPAIAQGVGGANSSITIVSVVAVFALVAWQLVLFVTASTNLGGFFLKFRYIRTDTGADAKAMVMLKYLVQGVFEITTLGLGLISYLVSYRDGQHWLDRAFKLAAVHNASVEVLSVSGAGMVVAPPSQPRVLPVQMPQPPAPRTSNFTGQMPEPSWPATQQPLQHAASTPGHSFGGAGHAQPPSPEPMPGMVPAAPDQPEPVPASPFAPANPWAMPVQGEEPARAPQPAHLPDQVPVYFAPHPVQHSSEPDFAVAEPQRPAAPSLLNDETVVDSDPAVAEVVLDDGQRIPVDAPVVLGRNPSPPPAYPFARCVPVVDESMRLSKTHLVLVPADGGVGVYDAGATNGVHVEVDGSRTRLPAAEIHPIPQGAVIHFGGRSLQVSQ